MSKPKIRKLAFGLSLALLATFQAAVAQTTCRGYTTRVVFGDVCAWGCSEQLCNCTVGACADGTVVVIKRPS